MHHIIWSYFEKENSKLHWLASIAVFELFSQNTCNATNRMHWQIQNHAKLNTQQPIVQSKSRARRSHWHKCQAKTITCFHNLSINSQPGQQMTNPRMANLPGWFDSQEPELSIYAINDLKEPFDWPPQSKIPPETQLNLPPSWQQRVQYYLSGQSIKKPSLKPRVLPTIIFTQWIWTPNSPLDSQEP